MLITIIARFALSDSSPKAERNLSSVGEFAREGELERRGEEISTGRRSTPGASGSIMETLPSGRDDREIWRDLCN